VIAPETPVRSVVEPDGLTWIVTPPDKLTSLYYVIEAPRTRVTPALHRRGELTFGTPATVIAMTEWEARSAAALRLTDAVGEFSLLATHSSVTASVSGDIEAPPAGVTRPRVKLCVERGDLAPEGTGKTFCQDVGLRNGTRGTFRVDHRFSMPVRRMDPGESTFEARLVISAEARGTAQARSRSIGPGLVVHVRASWWERPLWVGIRAWHGFSVFTTAVGAFIAWLGVVRPTLRWRRRRPAVTTISDGGTATAAGSIDVRDARRGVPPQRSPDDTPDRLPSE
jgi:hypothetical protein